MGSPKCKSEARHLPSPARWPESDSMATATTFPGPFTVSPGKPMQIAAISDLHYGKASAASMAPLFAQIAESADVLALCGDLTDYGLADEARVLAADLQSMKIPM